MGNNAILADVSCSYLFNPFTLLACIGRSTNAFATFFVLLSISHACQAKPTTSTFALAIATYLSLHPAFLLPPIGLLCYDRLCQQLSGPSERSHSATSKVATDQSRRPSRVMHAVQVTGIFLLACGFLLGLSRILLPSWSFIPSVYLTHLQLPDLTPNAGLWWYFFIEMFDPFRSFFLGVFWLHMLSYSAPFCLRLSRQPLAATVLMTGVIAVFEPYANIGNVGAFLSALCLLGHSFECKFLGRGHWTLSAAAETSQYHRSTATPSLRSLRSSTPPFSVPRFTIFGSTLAPEMPTSSTPSPWSGIWRCSYC